MLIEKLDRKAAQKTVRVWYLERHLLRVSFDTLQTTRAILLIIASAAIFAWILVSNQIAAHLSGSILSISDSPAFVMLAILLIVLVLGLFLETVAAITILVPVLLPVATSVGIDPVHLGVVIVLALTIGLLGSFAGEGEILR